MGVVAEIVLLSAQKGCNLVAGTGDRTQDRFYDRSAVFRLTQALLATIFRAPQL
jgi:hypothetical protein